MKLKTVFIISLLFAFYHVTNGQSTQKEQYLGKIGITVSSFGSSNVIYFEDVIGGSSYEGERFFSAGIFYMYPLKSWLSVETAAEYSNSTMRVQPPFYHGSEIESYNTKVSLLDFSVKLRTDFLNYFYANGGALLGVDMSNPNAIGNQSGIGGILGIGAKYDLGFGGSVFINPYVKMHAIIPFSQLGSFHHRLIESAIRFGISYQL